MNMKCYKLSKIVAAMSCGILCLIGGVLTAKADELDATITHEGSVSDFSESKITDTDHDTAISFDTGDKLIISTEDGSNIYGLYIIWDSPAQAWTLKADGNDIVCGQNGFLHEYVEIDGGATELIINIPADDMHIADIRIFGEGELPDDVQVWNPTSEKIDILIISSHADDELLFFGGVIPVYTYVYDADVVVCYMTEFWSTEKVREHEKLDGLWAAGLDIYPICLNYKDLYSMSIERAKQQYDEEKMTADLTEVFRKYNPQIVVTHDFAGEYGHGFHQLVTVCTVEAVENSMNTEYFPDSATEYGVWDVPKTYIHIYKENAITLDLSVTIPEKGDKTALQLVKDGYEMHVSQHKWWFYVSDTYEYSCAAFGLYRTTVGNDTGNNMLENLKTYKIQAKEEQERLERESMEQASREQESLEQASREQASLEQASREEESRQQASREQESREEASRLAKEKTEQTIFIIVGVLVVLVVVGAVVLGVRAKKPKKGRSRR